VPELRSAVTARGVVPWGVALAIAIVIPFYSESLTLAGVLFGLYASINLMWMVVVGTAGIYSFATLAIVGASAYVVALLGGASRAGYDIEGARALPVPLQLLIGLLVGGVLGALIAAPAIRLKGVYFALFTVGLTECVRAIVVRNDDLGGYEGLYGASTFRTPEQVGTVAGEFVDYFSSIGLLLVCLLVYWLVTHGRLGLLLRTGRDNEQVARGLGVDVVRTRTTMFVISSGMLGLIGAAWVSIYGSISPSIFEFNTLLLLLAMIVVGGLGSAKGALAGTALLLFIDQQWSSSGPPRLIAVGAIMLLVTLLLPRGLIGIAGQIADARRTPHDETDSGPAPSGGVRTLVRSFVRTG
jgi:branched-chain amino acid transport system permease protein